MNAYKEMVTTGIRAGVGRYKFTTYLPSDLSVAESENIRAINMSAIDMYVAIKEMTHAMDIENKKGIQMAYRKMKIAIKKAEQSTLQNASLSPSVPKTIFQMKKEAGEHLLDPEYWNEPY